MNDVLNEAPPTMAIIENEVDAADAILNRWKDAGTLPSDAGGYQDIGNLSEEATAPESQEKPEDEDIPEEEVEEPEDPEEELEEDEDDEEAEEAEEEDEEPVLADDDALVTIKVGDEENQVSVKELKRLWGQESSLTQKSQELASKRKEADELAQKSNLIMQNMLEKARERFKPYADVDMLLASKTMSDEDFAQLRKEASAAEQDLKFLTEEADSFYKSAQQQQQQQLQVAAQECLKVLREEIPEWSDELYRSIRQYAVSSGLQADDVNSYVDPHVIQILNKARLYDETKKVATVKRKAAKTKVLRSKRTPTTDNENRAQQQANSAEKLRSARSIEEMANVIVEGWKS